MPLDAPVLRVLGDILDAQRKLITLKTEADALTGKPYTVTVVADAADAKATMLKIASDYASLLADIDSKPIEMHGDGGAKMKAEMASIAAAWQALKADMSKGLINTPGLPALAILEAQVARLGMRLQNLKADAQNSIPVVESLLARLANTPLFAAGGGRFGLGGKAGAWA